MLFLASALKMVAEIALLALLGQGLLALMAGERRQGNFFYQVLQKVGQPFVWLTRRITPSFVLDRHVPLAAFCLLALLWLLATVARVGLCLQTGVTQCL